MNYLQNKNVYLCGAMYAFANCGADWRDQITPKLLSYGIHVEDPVKKTAFEVSEVDEDKKRFRELIMKEDFVGLKEAFWPVVRKDLRCVDKADFIIFCYDNPSAPTVGTIHELVAAQSQKKPILMKYDNTKLEAFNPWIATFIKPNHFFPEWSLLFEHLDKVNAGQFDTSLWTL
jgi:nucleoside 2-deoxyribosyltransferase